MASASDVNQLALSPKPLVIHIISGLMGGGAEMMLYKLLSKLSPEIFSSEVISLTDEGLFGAKIKELGISVYSLGMKRGRISCSGISYLSKILKKKSPAIIQTWMYHADLIGGLVGKQITKSPIVWNLRADIMPFSKDKRTYFLTKGCAIFSSQLPTRIVSCSEATRLAHVSFGYNAARTITIPNGFDLEVYCPNAVAAYSVRQELEIQSDVPLIGLMTRFDQRKDIPNFIEAAARFIKAMPQARFLICGNGMNRENEVLMRMLDEANIRECCFILGRREDIPRLTAALDVATSSSESEGFPNVLGEAMACGVPCVATDVGDSALIIGNTGIVVPPKNPQALADGWKKILTMDVEERRALGRAARRRIEENFSLDSVVARYENLYQELLITR